MQPGMSNNTSQLKHARQSKEYSPQIIEELVLKNISNVMAEFYEMQSQFLAIRYKMNHNIETSNILTFLCKNLHLEILRQREKYLDYDISLENFLKINNFMRDNINSFNHGDNITSIVKHTGIPKETVRRKLKKLIESKLILYDKKNKIFFFNLLPRNEKMFQDFIENDINALAKFILCLTNCFQSSFQLKDIKNEIKEQFSFYYYHYYSCQMKWLKMWQEKIKDLDLIFITIQALIPNIRNLNSKADDPSALNLNNLYTVIGRNNLDNEKVDNAINAHSISGVTGIPRATCIRKLEKLVSLGMLTRSQKTKRYYINQITKSRTSVLLTQDNIIYTVKTFSDYLSIVLNALNRKKL